MIIIPKENFMGKGIAKIVYQHPHDENICIKFPNLEKKRALKDIKREIFYLKKHQKNISWLAPYLGKVECNLGRGYMYEIVRNSDGTLSTPISSENIEKNREAIKQKVRSMYQSSIKQHAVINDPSLGNIFFKKNETDFDLILIDGFGNNNFIKIADYSKHFLISKLNRKFGKLCRRLQITFDFRIKH